MISLPQCLQRAVFLMDVYRGRGKAEIWREGSQGNCSKNIVRRHFWDGWFIPFPFGGTVGPNIIKHQVQVLGGLAFSRYQNLALGAVGNTLQQFVSVAFTGFGGKVVIYATR